VLFKNSTIILIQAKEKINHSDVEVFNFFLLVFFLIFLELYLFIIVLNSKEKLLTHLKIQR